MPNETDADPDPPLRADARRNHDALVTAAAKVFAAAGVDAPMKDIADRAGVGVGTVYRRFPKRSDLILAVFQHEVEACAKAAGALSAEHPPFEALARWIDRFLDLVVAKRGLAAALRSDDHAYVELRDDFEARLVPALQGLMEAAAAEIRPGVSAPDLWRAVALLCASGDFDQTRRMVALLVNGLRVGAEDRQG